MIPRASIKFLLDRVLTIFFPQTCRICHVFTQHHDVVCVACLDQIPWILKPHCPVCGQPLPVTAFLDHPCASCLVEPPPFDWHRSCALYEKPVDQLISLFKYHFVEEMSPVFAFWLIEKYREQIAKADYLIPVPLSNARVRTRTFNQSLTLARAMRSETKVPVLIHSLQKTRDTPFQTKLSKKERRANLKGAFVWRDQKINLSGKKVILIDDVYTTGSTLAECARVLKKEGPAEIGALTVAYNPLKIWASA